MHALRGLSPAEKQLKNAKTEYSEEHEEIANYTAIETLAEAVGDTEDAPSSRATSGATRSGWPSSWPARSP